MKLRCRDAIISALLGVASLAILVAARPIPSLALAVPILTYHFNNARNGANVSEGILAPANVNVNQFGKLFSAPVDGLMYAQPLYVPNLSLPGLGTHNVVYVETQHNSVYALDADNGATLWSVNLGPYQQHACAGDIGITGTPVIRSNTNVMYLVAATVRNGTPQQELHALDITTGAELPNSPVVISASVSGTGVGSANGVLTFNPWTQFQRPALALDGLVYIGFAVYCDFKSDSANGQGWMFTYNPNTMQRTGLFVTTPNALGGGIWQSGGGPAVDAYHNLYFSTGDGIFDANPAGTDYADTIFKLGSNTLPLLDYFTPYNQATLDANAQDLGSGGVVLLPDQPTAPTHLMVAAGKQGRIYLINRDNLGQFNSTTDNVVEELSGVIKGLFGTPAFWNNNLYFAGTTYAGADYPKAFSFTAGVISSTPTSQAATTYPYPGAIPVVSAAGQTRGIMWALQHGGTASGNEVLHAYNATNLANELYNSEQAGTRDLPGVAVKKQFESIIVDNGKVYVPTGQPQLTVFGLLPH
jgi:hypothetical protein